MATSTTPPMGEAVAARHSASDSSKSLARASRSSLDSGYETGRSSSWAASKAIRICHAGPETRQLPARLPARLHARTYSTYSRRGPGSELTPSATRRPGRAEPDLGQTRRSPVGHRKQGDDRGSVVGRRDAETERHVARPTKEGRGGRAMPPAAGALPGTPKSQRPRLRRHSGRSRPDCY